MRKLEYPAVGETLYRDVLPGGLRLCVAVKPGYARSHAFFAARYGGADRRFLLNGEATDSPMGVAHYLEHKMFDMPEGDAMYAMAASGAQPNAFTAAGMTAYYFDTTVGFEQNLRTLLRFVSTPHFTPESVEKERGIIAQEIRESEDDPDSVLYHELLRSLYAHHPMRDPILGTEESIRAITPEILYGCHSVFYHPGNMALAVVGDVDPERVRETALELLDRTPRPAPERDYGPPEGPLPVRTRFSRGMEVSAPQFLLGCKLPCPDGGTERLRQKLLCDLIVGCLWSQSSPFFTRNYADGLLNTSFSAVTDEGPGAVTLLAGGESRDPERVFSLFLAEAARTAEQGFDPAAFARRKKVLYGRCVRGLAFFGALCENLADGELEGYDYLDCFPLLESVTAEEAQAFLREHLRPERFAMSVVTPQGREAKEHA